MKYTFIRHHSPEYKTQILCLIKNIYPNGYYTWLKQSKSRKKIEDERLLGLIKQFWFENGCVYGYRRIFRELRENGQICGKNRVHHVHQLMKNEGIKSQVAYKRPRSIPGPVSQAVESILQQEFTARSG